MNFGQRYFDDIDRDEKKWISLFFCFPFLQARVMSRFCPIFIHQCQIFRCIFSFRKFLFRTWKCIQSAFENRVFRHIFYSQLRFTIMVIIISPSRTSNSDHMHQPSYWNTRRGLVWKVFQLNQVWSSIFDPFWSQY